MTTSTTEAEATGSRFTVPLNAEDFAALERRAAEERIPKTAHVRRLIAEDARSNPARTQVAA